MLLESGSLTKLASIWGKHKTHLQIQQRHGRPAALWGTADLEQAPSECPDRQSQWAEAAQEAVGASLGTAIHRWEEEEVPPPPCKARSHWQLLNFWDWNNAPASKGLFWEAVEGAASKSQSTYLGLGLWNGGFVLYPISSVFQQRSNKIKVAFLERSPRCEQKGWIREDSSWEQEALERFLAECRSEMTTRVWLGEIGLERGQWFKGCVRSS